jgi:uncharacterized protein with PIN domain
VRFWDSSAIVPLMIVEPGSARVRNWFDSDSEIIVWTLTPVELLSAIARLRREDFPFRADSYRRPSKYNARLGWVVGDNKC